MTRISVQNLTYCFDNGKKLFSELNFTLDNKVTGLIGRNGAGKSVLAALLAGEKNPNEGSITRFCDVGLLRQIGADDQFLRNKTISEFLGINEKLLALERIAQGSCDRIDFELINDNDWLLREEMKKQLLSLELMPNLFLPCKVLSGGQLMRLALNQIFQSDCGYLILDEPGNHLDKRGKQWLIEQIQCFTGGVLVISHNRDILRCVDNILELTSLGIRQYGGAYDAYAQQRSEELNSQKQQIEYTKNQIKQMHRTAQKNREKANQRATQGKRLSQSGSQAKILLSNKKQKAERASGNQINKQNRQLTQTQEQLSLLVRQHEILKPQNISLGKSEKRASRILDLVAVQLSYCKKEITLAIDFGDKVHLSGTNGCGKSTLLKTITGQLRPVKGDIKIRAKLCYLDQHFSLLDNSVSALGNLAAYCPHLTETEQRTVLAGIGLSGERAEQTVAMLSGGEKMKVAMSAISQNSGDILLLLDEPDNHLDIDSKQMLAQVLHDFSGTLLVVSHDQDFIEGIGISNQLVLD